MLVGSGRGPRSPIPEGEPNAQIGHGEERDKSLPECFRLDQHELVCNAIRKKLIVGHCDLNASSGLENQVVVWMRKLLDAWEASGAENVT
jgi:hypothetical protein